MTGATPLLILSGRSHYYEGHRMDTVTFPVRVMAELGIRDLLLTNASGAIHKRFRPGDFMVLSDHINFMGVNPLRGEVPPGREQFVDLSRVYDEALRSMLKSQPRRPIFICAKAFTSPSRARPTRHRPKSACSPRWARTPSE